MENRKNLKIAVLGPARNIEKYVDAVILNFLTIRYRFPSSDFFIIESDSSDRTFSLLKKWSKGFHGLHIKSLHKLRRNFPERTARLAHIRNYAYSLVRKMPYDLVIWMDLDDVTAKPMKPEIFDVLLNAPDGWAMLTATKADEYYDIWALRHPEICPFDCISEIKKAGWDNAWAHEKFSKEPGRRVMQSLTEQRHLEVDSAFGGLAIVKNGLDLGPNPFIGLDAAGNQVCEWVSYCSSIKKLGGRIFIDRDLRIG